MQKEIERFFSDAKFLQQFHPELRALLSRHHREHGRADEWQAALDEIEAFDGEGDFQTDTLRFGKSHADYEAHLRHFLPWRKGPIQFGETFVDTEWRSDWKWQRIVPHIASLEGRNILDIGCGNGYFLYRMLGEGARFALGIDPTVLFNFQFAVMQKLCATNDAFLLPLRGEHLPAFNCFDTVFSLGVLYHRRSPIDHITELGGFLRSGGELILETLVIEGDEQTTLIPKDRYAKMANVWFIPTTQLLEIMLDRAGFKKIRCVDVTVTSLAEQRATPWMEFQSLSDYLDPNDPTRTVEGYPAPTRATLIAEKP